MDAPLLVGSAVIGVVTVIRYRKGYGSMERPYDWLITAGIILGVLGLTMLYFALS